MSSCLAIGGLGPDDVDAVVFHEKPLVVLGRVLSARQRQGPAGVWPFRHELPVLLRRNVMVGYRIERLFRRLGGDPAADGSLR